MSAQKKYLALELAFWFALLTHGIGMITMILFLTPGVPGGITTSVQRAQYLASHADLWKLGWFPWQLSALSDLLIAIAFIFTPIPNKKIAKWIRLFIVVATLVALAPDQIGQFLWTTALVDLANQSIQNGSLTQYLKYEQPIYVMVCGWGALFYTLVFAGWIMGLVALKIVKLAFIEFSWALVLLSLSCSLLFLSPFLASIPFWALAASNGIFFTGLQLWFALGIHYLVSADKRATDWGREAIWTVPQGTSFKPIVQALGSSNFLRRVFEFIPPLSLASDIDGVVYVNYLVPKEKLEGIVPSNLKLQELGPDGKYALFTALTFRHKNFGPQISGGLRKMMFSGIVSNWRIHVVDPGNDTKGIYFISNVTSNACMSIGARVLSEGMPMHIASESKLEISNNHYSVLLKSGDGSAPDLKAELDLCTDNSFPEPWNECFKSFEDFLEYCVPQERAISNQAHHNRICYQEIQLGIPISECKQLSGTVESKTIEALIGDAKPLCFAAPALQFRFEKEHYRKLSTAKA